MALYHPHFLGLDFVIAITPLSWMIRVRLHSSQCTWIPLPLGNIVGRLVDFHVDLLA